MCLNIFTLDTFLIFVEIVNLNSRPPAQRWEAFILHEFKISMMGGQRGDEQQMNRISHF